MLRKEQNDLLTQTGPGTPMGQLFRRYWIPALLSEELPENDCPPVRVKLLSERLLAFRDTQGRYGLIDEFCAHRGVSLWFGRNEDCGLRCPYHGWKYDVTGQCVDVPSEPEGSRFKQKVKLKSYPMVERGGVVWIYMGPPEFQPPPPEWEFAMVSDPQRGTLAAPTGGAATISFRVPVGSAPAERTVRAGSAAEALASAEVAGAASQAGTGSWTLHVRITAQDPVGVLGAAHTEIHAIQAEVVALHYAAVVVPEPANPR